MAPNKMFAWLLFAAHPLAHLNALLNATATVLLIVGYWYIRQGRIVAHRRAMLAAFGVSIAFLISYLAYHVWPVGAQATPFTGSALVRKVVYYPILATHIVLAALVPVLALVTIWLGLRDARLWHRKVARWTLPIWLYVSVTGVLVYLMLYQWDRMAIL